MMNRQNALLVIVTLMTLCASCQLQEPVWEISRTVTVVAERSAPDNGKQYLQIYYENTGQDTIEQIKYELIKLHGTKADTAIRIIEPQKVLLPAERHIVARQVGQAPADFDAVTVGKVWVIKTS